MSKQDINQKSRYFNSDFMKTGNNQFNLNTDNQIVEGDIGIMDMISGCKSSDVFCISDRWLEIVEILMCDETI